MVSISPRPKPGPAPQASTHVEATQRLRLAQLMHSKSDLAAAVATVGLLLLNQFKERRP